VKRLLILVVALIVYGSPYPWHFQFAGAPVDPLPVLLNAWPTAWDRFELRDAIVNLLLYLPFGVATIWAMPRRFPRAVGAAAGLLGAMALSIGMELLQVYVPGRVCSLFDVVCDTAGAAAGISLALTYHPARAGGPQRAAIPAGPALILVLFAGYQLYPFFPVLSQTRLLHGVERLSAAEGFSLHEVWCCGAEWLAALVALGVLLDTFTGERAGRLLPTLAVLCLPLRMLVPKRTLVLDEVLGAAPGWLAWMLLRRRIRLRAAILVLGAAIVLRELAPFHLASAPSAFEWIPFRPPFDSERQSALVILARKAFDYGAMGWLLRANGVPWARAGAAVAAALAVLEAAQRWLPGRTPETTDAVPTRLLTFFYGVSTTSSAAAG
jgi:VanZ family protein